MTNPPANDDHLPDPEASVELRPETMNPRDIADLVDMVKLSLDKLVADQTARGDMKILSRAIRELRYAFKVFKPYRKRRKAAIFGSARTPSDDPCYQQAVEFGRKMVEQKWMVVTGAASGIMEAGHVGAGREMSMGLNIMLPFEQSSNPIIAGDPKLVNMKYFFTRKLMFVKETHALCCLPGGFGTLDEALEVLTLMQTSKRDLAPCVLLDQAGGSYWKDFDEFIRRRLLGGKMICPEDLSLYKITEDVDEAVDEVMRFYKVYHSLRYVRDQLVLRLETRPSDALLDRINDEFKDIVVSGDYRLSGPLSGERDESDLAHLTRLVFRFNRRSHGRLRQLIDLLNHSLEAPTSPA